MNAFSNVDMREVTRLTRAGKLAEAMALLQGRAELRAAAERPPSAAGAKPIAPPSPTIDRTAAQGNRTTLLTSRRTGALTALGRSMQALGERLAKAHPLPGVRQGVLSPM